MITTSGGGLNNLALLDFQRLKVFQPTSVSHRFSVLQIVFFRCTDLLVQTFLVLFLRFFKNTHILLQNEPVIKANPVPENFHLETEDPLNPTLHAWLSFRSFSTDLKCVKLWRIHAHNIYTCLGRMCWCSAWPKLSIKWWLFHCIRFNHFRPEDRLNHKDGPHEVGSVRDSDRRENSRDTDPARFRQQSERFLSRRSSRCELL